MSTAGPGQVVQLSATAHIHISPFGFWAWGREFLKARGGLQVSRKVFSPVPYFLTCRAIELELKAYLLAQGKPIDYVKNKVRHNLERALREAESEGLGRLVPITARRSAEVKAANAHYNRKGFEYFQPMSLFVVGHKPLPDLKILDHFGGAGVEGIQTLYSSPRDEVLFEPVGRPTRYRTIS